MSVLLIPTNPGVPFYATRVKLEGRDYNFRFAWNSRQERWFLDLADADGNAIFSGVKLLANRLMLRGRRWDPECPPGELFVADLTGSNEPPGFDDFGAGLRCELTYIESESIKASNSGAVDKSDNPAPIPE